MNAKKKGSTLVELLAVLVISTICLALLAPAVYNIATNAPPTAARKVIASSADPAESPGDEAIAAGQSFVNSAMPVAAPNADVNPQNLESMR